MITIEWKGLYEFVKELDKVNENYADLNLEIKFEARADYSIYQEMGTYKMQAQPFFYDNFDRGAQQIIDILESPDPTPDKIFSVADEIHANMQGDAPVLTGYLRSEIVVTKSKGMG